MGSGGPPGSGTLVDSGTLVSGCYSLLSHSVRTQKHVIWVNLVTAPAGEHTRTDRQQMNNPEETGSGEQMGLVGRWRRRLTQQLGEQRRASGLWQVDPQEVDGDP